MESGLRLAHFGSKLLVDFSTYYTQILRLTGAIIIKAHCKDKHNYVQITNTLNPSQYQTCALLLYVCQQSPKRHALHILAKDGVATFISGLLCWYLLFLHNLFSYIGLKNIKEEN